MENVLEEYLTPYKPPVKQLSDESFAEQKEVSDRILRCFISYRFADPVVKQIIDELTQFLSLIGVEATSGAGYEPRSIQDKVAERIRKNSDFTILLIDKNGESFWTRDEIGMAKSIGSSIIPVVENGADFFKGIYGDLEYIPFESGHIGDTFVKILQAIEYIKIKHVGTSGQIQ